MRELIENLISKTHDISTMKTSGAGTQTPLPGSATKLSESPTTMSALTFTRTDNSAPKHTGYQPCLRLNNSNRSTDFNPAESELSVVETAMSDIAQVLQSRATCSLQISSVVSEAIPHRLSQLLSEDAPNRSTIHLNAIADKVTDFIAHADLTAAHTSLYRAVKAAKGAHALDSSLSSVYSKLLIFLSDKNVDSALRSLVLITFRKGDLKSPDLEDDDEDDPLERYVPAAHKCITWKLFERIQEDGIRLEDLTYTVFSKRLLDNDEPERALRVLEALGRKNWDMDTFKTAIKCHLMRKPKDVNSAQKLLSEFGQATITVDTGAEKSRIVNQTLVEHATDAEKHVMWLYFHSQVMEARWADCVLRFEETRNRTKEEKVVDLDNAMMEVCLTYEQFEYGWQIYESMVKINKHTPRVVVALCRKAFFCESDAMNTQDRSKWEARAWALYMRFKTAEHLRASGGAVFILHELLEIAADSPEVGSRYEKVNRIFGELKAVGAPDDSQRDEWIIQPVLRLCLRLFKSTKVEGSSMAEKYYNRSFEIYNEFRRSGHKCHAETYIVLLELVSVHGNVDKFKQLCKDLTSSGLQLNGEAFTAMEQMQNEMRCPSPAFEGEHLKGEILQRLSVCVREAELNSSSNDSGSEKSNDSLSGNRRSSLPVVNGTRGFVTSPIPAAFESSSAHALTNSVISTKALRSINVLSTPIISETTIPPVPQDHLQRLAEFRRKLSDLSEEDARKLLTQCISLSLNEISALANNDNVMPPIEK